MKTPSLKKFVTLAVLGFASISTAFAATTFETLDSFTAGGTPSIPAVVTTEGSLTLALKAQQRYSNPPLTNDGAGTYFATTGQNGIGSLWNFDFYIENKSTTNDVYTYNLSYGLVGGTVYSFNPLDDADALAFLGSTGAYQDSQNLLFSSFGGASNAFSGSYNPNANGTYEFVLTATNLTQNTSSSSSMRVKVNSVPDGGSTLVLLGLALGGVSAARRKFRA